ncbi:hypothetical protein J5X84_07770 [Streptosporangiaceae bacterium NEAU-GS5]|nr:hypothetical protein [Streptosporangiaceae bacterium NEAU-GS5]
MSLRRIIGAGAGLLLTCSLLWASPASAAAVKPVPITPKTFSGSGDDVFRIRATTSRGIALIRHTGESNFAVWTLKSSGANSELIVNTIGDYTGTVVFDTYSWHKTAGFKIEADGTWRVRVAPISYAPLWKFLKATGVGDQVLKLKTPIKGFHTLRYKHAGGSNFVVYAFPLSGNGHLLVNKIGKVSGKVTIPAGTRYVSVQADGAWTLTRG